MKKGVLFQVSVYLLSLALLAALYTFIIIPGVRKKEDSKLRSVLSESAESYVPVLIYRGETPLLSGVIITDVNRDNFTVEKVPPYCLVNNAVPDFDMINGKRLNYTIAGGQQISADLLGGDDDIYSETKRLKEFKVKSLVGEHAQKGTYVDILARYPDGSYDVLIEKVRIYDILCNNNHDTAEYLKDSDGFYTVLFAVDESEFMILNSALLTGYLDIRLYLADRAG